MNLVQNTHPCNRFNDIHELVDFVNPTYKLAAKIIVRV